jgi:hypothetical protein
MHTPVLKQETVRGDRNDAVGEPGASFVEADQATERCQAMEKAGGPGFLP